MGNEGSMLQGLELDPQPLENTDEWTLHSATLSGGATPQLSVFAARQPSGLGGVYSLEQAAKNLMLHRHPSILKYVSSWSRQGRMCMATESVRPLTRELTSQTALQICVGLHDVLKALVFLHEKAISSHNNVCCAAIYVTSDGSWKLGGLEFLRRFSELNTDFLQKTRARRYEKAVPPEEDSSKTLEPRAIDCFAFGVLVEEVTKKIPEDALVPGMREFRDMCRKQLQNSEPSLRPKLSQLLDHPIFSHKFVLVHDFLAELPVKSDIDKATFFRSLVNQLREFPEELVASQLGALLLARIVFLDQTAQKHLLPAVLRPRCEDGTEGEDNASLFTIRTYQQYVVPRLLHIFGVRDAQVRLLLLQHFEYYCGAFGKEQLQKKVLPELLVGIKDTDDTVVASTLHALATLVPVLGAATVIGGKRARLFTDGRPKMRQPSPPSMKFTTRLKDGKSETIKPQFSSEDSGAILSIAELPERPSPDGGEDFTSATPVDEETDTWSDWDVNEAQISNGFRDEEMVSLSPADTESTIAPEHIATHVSHGHGLSSTSRGTPLASLNKPLISSATQKSLLDISSLDIKNSPNLQSKKPIPPEDFNFFQDMEPVLSKTHVLQLNDINQTSDSDSKVTTKAITNCFDIDLSVCVEADAGEGWGDTDDWGENSDIELPTS